MQVIKRNGQVVDFDFNKIEKAVSNAARSCGITITSPLTENSFHWGEDPIPVEKIQDVVEKWLMKNEPEVAKEYILYREKHKNIREFVRKKKEFITNYENASNTANATIDDNSNVANRNIAVLNAEIH